MQLLSRILQPLYWQGWVAAVWSYQLIWGMVWEVPVTCFMSCDLWRFMIRWRMKICLRVTSKRGNPRIKLPYRERTGSSTSFIVSFQSLLPPTNSEKQHHHHHRQASLIHISYLASLWMLLPSQLSSTRFLYHSNSQLQFLNLLIFFKEFETINNNIHWLKHYKTKQWALQHWIIHHWWLSPAWALEPAFLRFHSLL